MSTSMSDRQQACVADLDDALELGGVFQLLELVCGFADDLDARLLKSRQPLLPCVVLCQDDWVSNAV